MCVVPLFIFFLLHICVKNIEPYSYTPAQHSCVLATCNTTVSFDQQFQLSPSCRSNRFYEGCRFTLSTSSRTQSITILFSPFRYAGTVSADYQYSYEIAINTETNDVRYDITYSCYLGDSCDIDYLQEALKYRINIKYVAMWRLLDLYFINSEIALNLQCSEIVIDNDTNMTIETTRQCNGGLCKAYVNNVDPSLSETSCVPDNVYRRIYLKQNWYVNWTDNSIAYHCNQNECNGKRSFDEIKDILNNYNFTIVEKWVAPPPTTSRPSSAHISARVGMHYYLVFLILLCI